MFILFNLKSQMALLPLQRSATALIAPSAAAASSIGVFGGEKDSEQSGDGGSGEETRLQNVSSRKVGGIPKASECPQSSSSKAAMRKK